MTGQSYVELDFTNPTRYPPLDVPWKPRYDYIPSIPSTFSQVQEGATSLLAKFQQVDIPGLANGLLGLVTELRGTLRDGGDAQKVMVQATATLQALQLALAQADVPALADSLRQTLASARALAQGPQTKQLLQSATQAADRLTQATARLPQLIASLDAVAKRANAGSADLEAGLVPLLRDARTTVSALRETSEALRRDPAQVVLGGAPAPEHRPLRRRALFAAAASLAGCSVLPARPYLVKRDWPLEVTRPAALPPRPGGKTLLVRSLRAAPGLEQRGLQIVQDDTSIHVDFYEEWSVPPADAVEDALRRWLAASGLFAAILAPGSRATADYALEGELLSLLAIPAQRVMRASLNVVLLDLRPTPVRILLQADETADALLPAPTPPEIAAAGRLALARLLTKVEAGIARAIRLP